MVTYDFLLFIVLCLILIGYLVWERARKDPDNFKMNHPFYELRKKELGEVNEDQSTTE